MEVHSQNFGASFLIFADPIIHIAFASLIVGLGWLYYKWKELDLSRKLITVAYSVAEALKPVLPYWCFTIYWLTAVFLGVCLVDGLIFNKYTFSYIVVLLLLLFIVTKSAPEFDNRDKESIFHGSLRWLYRFVIYWLSGVILEVCLVWLLLTVKYTFIHIIIVLLLLSLVFSFIWIIVKIPIDWFYNREIKNPFSDYMKITLPEKEVISCVEQFNYYLNALLHLLFFSNTRYSLVFGVVLLLLSFVTNYLNISLLIALCVILRLFSPQPLSPDVILRLFPPQPFSPGVILRLLLTISPLYGTARLLKEISSGEQETVSSSVARGNFIKCLCFVVHYVIYWRVYWLSGVILGVCLVWLLLTVKYTFIHIIVVLLLLSLVFSFICIIVKIAIDFFYNREIKPLFSKYRWLKIALPKDEVKVYLVTELNYVLNKLTCLLFVNNIKASFLFGVILLLLSLVTNYFNISRLIFLCVIFLFFIPQLYAWYWKTSNTTATASPYELLNMIKEVWNHMQRISGEQSAELRDLLNELQEVTDWFFLGLCLGLSQSQLEVIEQDHRTNDERRREVLATWARQEKPTWSKVVHALMEMGRHQVLASQIAAIYGVRQSRLADKTSSETREGQSHTGEEQQMLPTSAQKPQMGLKDLLKELQQVTDWHKLGLHLDVPGHKLDDIEATVERNSGNTDDCRREMLMIWMESEIATWARVVHALIHIDQLVLAANIANKYGVVIPKSVIEKTQPQRLSTSMEQETQIQSGAASEQALVKEHQGTQLKDVPMTDLLTELQNVTDWFTLGVWLEVPTPLLKAIREDHTDTDQCRREMLFAWSKQEVPTWPRVVHALSEMGMAKLAIAIAEKYGISVPSSLHEALKQKAESARMQVTLGRNDHQEEEEALRIFEYHEGDIQNFRQLLNELQEVTDWISFGVYLRLSVPTLKQIQKEQQTIERCRREMLLTWWKEQTCTWLKVIQALVNIKRVHLAVKIASKYSVTVPQSLYNKMKDAVPVGEELRCLSVEKSDEKGEMAEQPNALVGCSGDASLKDLVNELQEVTDWFQLGLCLKVPLSVLRTIQQENKEDTHKCREEMLRAWMKQEIPMWSTIVKALLDMEMTDLALKIASKDFAVRTDSVVGDGGKDKRRQGERSGGGGRSKKENSIPWPLLVVFGILVLIGLPHPWLQTGIDCGPLSVPKNGYASSTSSAEGDIAIYSCRPGYVLEGGSIRVCDHYGSWTGSMPVCRRINCSLLDEPKNGTVSFSYIGEEVVATYSCKPGFVLEPEGENIRVCACSGNWTGSVPECRKINCGPLDEPKNGFVSLSSTAEGATATYSCKPDFVLEGEDIRVCNCSGNWTGSVPECRRINCGSLNEPQNGFVFLSATAVGATATYSCKPGFVLEPEEGNARVCSHSGKWTGSAPECRRINCGLLDEPKNGTISLRNIVEGVIATYSCKPGFLLEGEDIRVCNRSGNWTGSIPECRIIDCGPLDEPKNGFASSNGTVVGDTATYNCNPGFVLEPEEGNMRVCTHSGKWTGSVPECRRVDCSTPTQPNHGVVSYDGTGYNMVVVYKCDEGYSLIGSSTRVCQSSGEWSGEEPFCEGKHEHRELQILTVEKIEETSGFHVQLVVAHFLFSIFLLCGVGFLFCGVCSRSYFLFLFLLVYFIYFKHYFLFFCFVFLFFFLQVLELLKLLNLLLELLNVLLSYVIATLPLFYIILKCLESFAQPRRR